jgi:hypothetical protein
MTRPQSAFLDRAFTWIHEELPMSEASIKLDYRKWRGEKEYLGCTNRQYNFPVHVRRIGEPTPQLGK